MGGMGGGERARGCDRDFGSGVRACPLFLNPTCRQAVKRTTGPTPEPTQVRGLRGWGDPTRVWGGGARGGEAHSARPCKESTPSASLFHQAKEL